MTHTSDKLAAIFARLALQSPQAPGKPPKKKPEGKGKKGGTTTLPAGTSLRTLDKRAELARSYRLVEPDPDKPGRMRLRPRFVGALSPTRCGATQSQTRSTKLLTDVETVPELAASLAAVHDQIDLALVIYVAIPGWHLDIGRLMLGLREILLDQAMSTGHWPSVVKFTERRLDDTPDVDPQFDITTDVDMARRLVVAVLRELGHADACQACNASGRVLDLTAKPPKWVSCVPCEGTSRVKLGIHRRAKALHIGYGRYRNSDLRFAYEWLLRECNSRIERAAAEIAEARGGREDDED